jgi:Ca2+-binding RTX toxin-like protein
MADFYQPAGSDFLVPTHSTGVEVDPATATLASGRFVVVWRASPNFTNTNQIRGQVYEANGTKVGGEFQANVPFSSSVASVSEPTVTALASGGFVVGWKHAPDFAVSHVKAQLFDSVGAKVGGEILVSTSTENQGNQSFAALGSGFVAVWDDGSDSASHFDVKAQLFDAGGVKIGAQISVNTATAGAQQGAAAAALVSGGFVVTWTDSSGDGGDTSGTSVKGQRFDARGNKLGAEFLVNSTTSDAQYSGDVASLPSGGFIVAWSDLSAVGADASGSSVKAQIYDAAGNRIGGEILVNSSTLNDQIGPDLTVLPSGDFVVTWRDSSGQGGDSSSTSIKAQAFDSGGRKIGGELLVNSTTQNGQNSPSITWRGSDGFVVSWVDHSGQGGDADGYGVKARMFSIAPAGPETITGTEAGDTLTGANGSDRIDGGGGDDMLLGRGGGDDLAGNGGSDEIDGGEGDDFLYSGDRSPAFRQPYYNNPWNAPVLDTGAEVDTLRGGAGSDRLFAGYGDNADGGGNGAYGGDYLYISFQGASAGVTADFRLASQVIGGGTITGFETISWVQGSNFDDTITLAGGYFDFTAIFGMGGNDHLIAGYETGHMDGGDGDDIVDGRGSQYLQRVYGGNGNDTLYTHTNGIGEAYGGDGNDTIYSHGTTYGGAGNDTIVIVFSYYPGRVYGEGGDDLFYLQNAPDTYVYGGEGADAFYYGKAFSAGDRLDGGTGSDQLGLQGNYNLTLAAATMAGVDVIVLLSGSESGWGDTANDRYDYALAMNDGNVASGGVLTVNANGLLAGEDLSFNGSAETDGGFKIFSGFGAKMLVGGAQSDGFFFGEGRFGAGDMVDGGGGADDQMGIRGNYTIDFNASGFTGVIGVETLVLISANDPRFLSPAGATEFDYAITLADAMVVPGGQLTVTGVGLGAAETMNVDGSAETSGTLRLFGGAANDILIGGGGDDRIFGGVGADTLRSNGGADTFIYTDVAQSGGSAADRILDFSTGTDKLDLSAIDANSNAEGNQAFSLSSDGSFHNTAGELRTIWDAQNNRWVVEGDTDGNGSADFTLYVTTLDHAPLGSGDFIF